MIFYNLPNCRLHFSERARAFFRAGRQSEAMEVAAVYTMLVVDDEYYLRLGFKSLLDWDALGIRIVGEAADGEEGLRLALREKPDLIVADIRMPYMNGLELMEKLRENHIESVVIVLSGFSEFEYAQKAIENGAFAYLLKPIDQDAFLDTVKKALVHIKTEKSSKQYYELLKSELSSMKEVFLKNLLEGAVRDREEIVKKIRMLDVPLDPGNNVAVVIRLDNFLLVRERKPFHLLFIEEPVLCENYEAFRELADSTSTPIATGERLYTRVAAAFRLPAGGRKGIRFTFRLARLPAHGSSRETAARLV